MLERMKSDYDRHLSAFYDRGIPDLVAYARLFGLEPPRVDDHPYHDRVLSSRRGARSTQPTTNARWPSTWLKPLAWRSGVSTNVSATRWWTSRRTPQTRGLASSSAHERAVRRQPLARPGGVRRRRDGARRS